MNFNNILKKNITYNIKTHPKLGLQTLSRNQNLGKNHREIKLKSPRSFRVKLEPSLPSENYFFGDSRQSLCKSRNQSFYALSNFARFC